MADEELLGEATLAKLMSGEFDEEREAQAAKAAAQEQPAAAQEQPAAAQEQPAADGAPVVEPAETKPQE
jgi:hypothetical protein